MPRSDTLKSGILYKGDLTCEEWWQGVLGTVPPSTSLDFVFHNSQPYYCIPSVPKHSSTRLPSTWNSLVLFSTDPATAGLSSRRVHWAWGFLWSISTWWSWSVTIAIGWVGTKIYIQLFSFSSEYNSHQYINNRNKNLYPTISLLIGIILCWCEGSVTEPPAERLRILTNPTQPNQPTNQPTNRLYDNLTPRIIWHWTIWHWTI